MYENQLENIIKFFCDRPDSKWKWKKYGDGSSPALLIREDKLYMWLEIDKKKNRLSINLRELSREITISLEKPAITIAKEIDKRLLKPAEEAWQEHLRAKQEEELALQIHAANFERMWKAVHPGKEFPERYKNRRVLGPGESFSGSIYSNDVYINNCQVNSNSVYLSIRNLPFDLAEKVFILLQDNS